MSLSNKRSHSVSYEVAFYHNHYFNSKFSQFSTHFSPSHAQHMLIINISCMTCFVIVATPLTVIGLGDIFGAEVP